MTKPWERQKGESSKSFAWFEVYLDLGASRKLPKVIEKIESMTEKDRESNDSAENIIPLPTYDQLQNQSKRWHWTKRTRAYDNYLSNFHLIRKTQSFMIDQAIKHNSKIIDNVDVKYTIDIMVNDIIEKYGGSYDVRQESKGNNDN